MAKEKSKENKKPVLKTQYLNYSQHGITFPETSRTQQSYKEECNINNVIKRYKATGELPRQSTKQFTYGVQVPTDLTQFQFNLARVKSDYESLPDAVKGGLTLDQYLQQQSEENVPENENTAPDAEFSAEAENEHLEQPAQQQTIEAEKT